MLFFLSIFFICFRFSFQIIIENYFLPLIRQFIDISNICHCHKRWHKTNLWWRQQKVLLLSFSAVVFCHHHWKSIFFLLLLSLLSTQKKNYSTFYLIADSMNLSKESVAELEKSLKLNPFKCDVMMWTNSKTQIIEQKKINNCKCNKQKQERTKKTEWIVFFFVVVLFNFPFYSTIDDPHHHHHHHYILKEKEWNVHFWSNEKKGRDQLTKTFFSTDVNIIRRTTSFAKFFFCFVFVFYQQQIFSLSLSPI